MIADKLYTSIKEIFDHGWVRGGIRIILYTPIGCGLAASILSRVSSERRLAGAHNLMKFAKGGWPEACLIWSARMIARIGGSAQASEVYWLFVAFRARPDKAVRELSGEAARAFMHSDDVSANLQVAHAVAHYQSGNFREASRLFAEAQTREPEKLMMRNFGLSAAYASGILRDLAGAMAYFGRYYGVIDFEEVLDNEAARERFAVGFMERAAGALLPRLVLDRASGPSEHRYGVFFHSSTEALGHAILDPYYFLALRRQDYDRIYFLGPGRKAYRPASAVCLRLIEQHGTYTEVGDDSLLNASWMHFGTLKEGPVELCVEHYWSLLREAVHRTRDASDPYFHNAWHLEIPEAIERRGEKFARRIGIALDRPLVVVHARHSAYHGIHAQAFRDADIRSYAPAIRHLLGLGYQVIRIGDQAMPRLKISHDDYIELPFQRDYRPEYDPFFIAHSDFMIGCQSGPCAYARALGIPLLSVNAVLHYTLLPARMEMACFKRYQHKVGEEWVDIGLEDALEVDVQHFDNAYQFEAAGIRTRDAEAPEIVAAVDDMIDWLAAPERPLTTEQERFRAAADAKCTELMARGPQLEKPIADYLGIALPGYRLAPTVAKMREGKQVEMSAERLARARRAVAQSG